MPNERLRDALLRNGLDLDHVAKATSVDPKTVERWITQSRTPYPRHRHTIAAMVRETENYLWPDAVAPARRSEIGTSEIIKVYPHRHSVPNDLWEHLLAGAGRYIEVLIYAGMFLADNPRLIRTLKAKGESGTKIRILIGDPAARELARRGEEEGIGREAIPAKARNALAFFKPLTDAPHTTIRVHGTTLYNSIYRFDDEMLVNTHVYGFAGGHAPLLHLRRLSGGDLFETYSESFDSVWGSAKTPKW
ncbi:XRE family transcriptional regulator [Actinokineospora sp. PR83]|uniref:XRE family transcriptional regulator n=1 Tax=Actinokineospora sp. PR83 TaxID=2884908 RepID=UPI001F2F4BCD|nr:XRE family transcriptional regulator [Actinokineospora sp. PR83]MCG8917889.1 XRE family transcriptional regulator [Actinokineospora sp. PR83]